MIGKTISHYKILEKIGEGGMGVVFKAEDTKLRRTVALKFLPPELMKDQEAKERFIQEAQAAAALNHPNICTVYEIDEADGRNFIAMEFIKGHSLKEKVASGPMEIDESLEIVSQITEGLLEAHNNGIIHRDIKPANIMLTHRGQVKIMDFGLAKLEWGVDLTKTATIMGTVAYMSPEQARGEKVDHRTDVWALGAVLYEMLSGVRPFKSAHDQAAIYAILNEMPEPLHHYRKDIPGALERIVFKALEKTPTQRYKNMGEFLRNLNRISFIPTQTEEEKPSIAVLPFVDMSSQKDQEYFSDGLSEAVLNSLTKIKDFKVVARTSAFSFKGKDVDIREIGKKLGVNKVLEGSVQKAGNRLRITAQLINVADGYHLWSERFDRNMDDVFAIQDEISLAIVDNLELKLLKGEKTKLIKRHTNDTEAYNLYLEGRYFYNKRTEEDMRRSIKYFERALTKDPKFALPYAGLADTYASFGFYHWIPFDEARSRAKEYALEGLEVDDTVGETHAAYANCIMWFDYKWDEAEKEYKKAIELSPSDVEARHMYAHVLECSGRFEEAIAEMGRALELEPLSVILNHCMGNILLYSGDYKGAIALFKKTIAMDPGFPLQYFWLGRSYIQTAELQKAIEIFEKGTEFPTVNAMVLGGLGLVYALAGREKDAREKLDQLDKLSKEKYVDSTAYAYVYMGLGDKDKTFEHLDNGFGTGDMYLIYLPVDPVFKELHGDPRFSALMKKLGL
jgi:serine/threonine-protein kinase